MLTNSATSLYIKRLYKFRAETKRKARLNLFHTILQSGKKCGKDDFINRVRRFFLRSILKSFRITKKFLKSRTLPFRFLRNKTLKLRRLIYQMYRHKALCTTKKKVQKKNKKLLRLANRKRRKLGRLIFYYVQNALDDINNYKQLDRTRVRWSELKSEATNFKRHWVRELVYRRCSFNHKVKSARVIRFLSKIHRVFKVRRYSRYYHLFKPFRFPFRIGTKRTTFYLKHKKHWKTVSYNDYRALKIFFGGLKPQKFWRSSRAAIKKDAMGWTFFKKYSYLDFSIDYFLSRINFVENIFQGKKMVESCKVMINSKVIQTCTTTVKPYDWIEVITAERFNFKQNFLAKLAVQRTQTCNLKQVPNFIEVNWALFRFFILPLITLRDIIRPYKTYNLHVGGGKKQPAKLA